MFTLILKIKGIIDNMTIFKYDDSMFGPLGYHNESPLYDLTNFVI